MMHHTTHVAGGMDESYAFILHDLIKDGENVTSRAGRRTLEVVDWTLVLEDPARSLPEGTGRELNTNIAAVEALRLLGGVPDPPTLLRAGSDISRYGQRIREQLPKVVERLQADASTQQAIITLFTDGVYDYPCALCVQFLIRRGKLELITTMRANDAWRGLPYDVFMFTQLQLMVAHVLGVNPGAYTHKVGSFYIFEQYVQAARELHAADVPWYATSLFNERVDTQEAMQVARDILTGDLTLFTYSIVNSEALKWYVDRVVWWKTPGSRS